MVRFRPLHLTVGVIALAAFVGRSGHDPNQASAGPTESSADAQPVTETADVDRTPPSGSVTTETEPSPPAAVAPSTEASREVGTTDEDRGERSWDDRRRRRRNRYPGLIPTPSEWEPPAGPVKIALQAGHWKAHEAPHELRGLRGNGARWENVAEWEANLEIARRTSTMLEEAGYEVDLLPAIVPPGYRAHLFISIHADGSGDPRASGYRVAAPRRDATGRADRIASLLEESYGELTGLRQIPTTTRRMRNYYAFNFRRYEHALHPMTIAVILETGFLTSRRDREVILDDPDRAARAIVHAVTRFSETPPPALASQN